MRAFQFLAHPTKVCLFDDPTLANHPLLPRWEFSNTPPDDSPVLVLPKGQGKIGVWSIKHRCSYLSGLGYLVMDDDNSVHLVETTFFSPGDFHFSAPTVGMRFNCTLSLNDWDPPHKDCACHVKHVF